MKLIDGDRLLKLMAGGGDPDYAHHLETNLFPKCTLSPADLKEMNLDALGVLRELIAGIREQVEKSWGMSETAAKKLLQKCIKAESAADLKVPEIQVKARVFDEIYEHVDGFIQLNLRQLLREARAKLALPASAQAQKGDKTDDQ